jgi:predicted HAD superfamily hydrolase
MNLSSVSVRLKALLDAEEKQYELEFMANLETPEQVRERMAQRLVELKNKREDERQDEVNRRLEQRFKDSRLSPVNNCFN